MAPSPRLASTVMLVRDAPQGIIVCLARRSARSRFMPGAYVFPGGAVDAVDGSPGMLARVFGAESASALAVAALRELVEEVGILFACRRDGVPVDLPADAITAIRADLAHGALLADLLLRHELLLDASGLTPYSNLLTPASEPIRFDTHFFVAVASDEHVASTDDVELHDGLWLPPCDALARADRGELSIVFPTRLHLDRIARFDSVAAFIAHARARTIRQFSTSRDGAGWSVADDW